MVKLKIARVAASAAASASLIAGFSGIAGASPHNYYGHGSNSATFTNTKTVSVNNVGVNNHLGQDANSGDATVLNFSHHHSSSSSDATTGDATNNASFGVNGTVKNSAASADTSTMTTDSSNDGGGHGSSNSLTMTNTKTVSVNNVKVSNDVHQDATTGDATVVGGHGGSATTGDASNTSNSNVTLDVEN